MKRFFALLRVNFLSMLKTFSFGIGKNKTKQLSGVGAMVFMAAISVYISGAYSFLLATSLNPYGILYLLPVLMVIMSCVMALMFTAFGASGIVFGGKDSDLMLALPVNAFEVMLCKILALYIENLCIVLFMMIPMIIAYLVTSGIFSFAFVILVFISSIFIALIPTFLGLIIGFLITYFSSRIEKKTIITTLLYFVFFGAIMVLSFRLNSVITNLVQNADAIETALSGWLFPFGLFSKAVMGSVPNLLLLIAVCSVPFFLITWIFSTRYKVILSKLKNHTSRNDYKITSVTYDSQFQSLYKKEAGKYFGTTIYIFNTAFGILILLGASIFSLFKKDVIVQYLSQFSEIGISVFPIVLAMVCLMVATVCTTCVSISLEGKTLWILKESPLKTKDIFLAKAALNLTVTIPALILSAVFLSFSLSLNAAHTLLIILLGSCVSVFTAFFGLIINLKFPKLDAENDTIVVKQSAASMLGIFGGMILVGIGAALYSFALSRFISIELFALISSAVLAAAIVLSVRYLFTKGVQEFWKLG